MDKLGVHEVLEIHELMTFKSLCLTKSTMMQGLVTDQKLKDIMQQDVTMSSKQLEELKTHLS